MFRWVNPFTEKKEVIGAHRISFFLTNGTLPDHGRHTCDNPSCVRPGHIIDGTHADNMRDRNRRFGFVDGGKSGSRKVSLLKGGGANFRARNQRGESNDSAVLTDEIVLEARRRARTGEIIRVIANDLEVPRATLNYAVLGKTWTHLDAAEAPVRGVKGHGKLTFEQIAEVIALQGQLSAREVGERYGITDIAVKYHWRKHPLTSSR